MCVYDEYGIADGYHDVNGVWHHTADHTRAALRAAMGEPGDGAPLWFVDEGDSPSLLGPCHLVLEDGTDVGVVHALPSHLPIGYHHITPAEGGASTLVVVAPRRCPAPPYGWGVAAQVYALWRADGWGVGDLRDVEQLGQAIGALGASAMLLSPLHAPAPSMPQEPSPYYPSSRRWLNPLLIPLDGAPAEFGFTIPNEQGALIDRDRAWAARRQRLSQLFHHEAGDAQWRGWAAGVGSDLWQYATWCSLADRFGHNWREWPAPYRHPNSDAVRDLPLTDRSFAEACEFHAWLQWKAREAVAHAGAAAGVALIGDLAVGCRPDGADGWLHQDLMALGMGIGAPPDPFNAAGQDWGLPPFVPWRLRNAHYAPFIAMVRAALFGMGGLRIDHVMGLFRQFWVPAGGSPADGGYVQLPAHELLAIIRLEACRAGAFVCGEDLGTVEPHVREQLRDSGIMGTKVWWFDQHPEAWPSLNLATVTTHDLPTVVGVQYGIDGDDAMRAALDSFAAHSGAACADAETGAGSGTDAGTDMDTRTDVGLAAHPFDVSVRLHQNVAASPATLCLVGTDDLAGTPHRPNHPGTSNAEQPNWCRRLSVDVDQLVHGEPGASLIAALRSRRP